MFFAADLAPIMGFGVYNSSQTERVFSEKEVKTSKAVKQPLGDHAAMGERLPAMGNSSGNMPNIQEQVIASVKSPNKQSDALDMKKQGQMNRLKIIGKQIAGLMSEKGVSKELHSKLETLSKQTQELIGKFSEAKELGELENLSTEVEKLNEHLEKSIEPLNKLNMKKHEQIKQLLKMDAQIKNQNDQKGIPEEQQSTLKELGMQVKTLIAEVSNVEELKELKSLSLGIEALSVRAEKTMLNIDDLSIDLKDRKIDANISSSKKREINVYESLSKILTENDEVKILYQKSTETVDVLNEVSGGKTTSLERGVVDDIESKNSELDNTINDLKDNYNNYSMTRVQELLKNCRSLRIDIENLTNELDGLITKRKQPKTKVKSNSFLSFFSRIFKRSAQVAGNN